ncbi:hypothetical protein SNK04_013858 [Fusarium graminearum]
MRLFFQGLQGFLPFLVLLLYPSLLVDGVSAAATSTKSASLTNGTSSDAQALVEQALKVLAVVNKDRIENPVFNDNKREEPDEENKPAPLLDYEADPKEITPSRLASRDDKNSTVQGSYRIPKAR